MRAAAAVVLLLLLGTACAPSPGAPRRRPSDAMPLTYQHDHRTGLCFAVIEKPRTAGGLGVAQVDCSAEVVALAEPVR